MTVFAKMGLLFYMLKAAVLLVAKVSNPQVLDTLDGDSNIVVAKVHLK